MKGLLFKSIAVGMAALILVGGSFVSQAQEEDAARGPRGAGRMRAGRDPEGMRRPGRMRGEFDRTRMREMMAQRLQQALGCTSEEWKVIGPRVEKVTELRMQPRMRAGMIGRRGRRGEPGLEGRPGGPPPPKEVADLTKALDSEDTPPAEIEAKLKAFRAAAKKREEALKKARSELREVLTLRQEARLVLMGILD
jgi:Spy/CpxP family protein refolding chaperone